MKQRKLYFSLIPVYGMVFLLVILTALIGNKAVQTASETALYFKGNTIIIDAGHGGEDGGALSCTGVAESAINLEISTRLNDLMQFLGFQTKMIRTEDISIHTEGETIAQRKIADLKERVRICNETDNAFLLSIHQNNFADGRYHGAQVFYSTNTASEAFAKKLQKALIATLNPGSNRDIKQAQGIYLLDKIKCPGVLIECGFLSNPAEEALLRSDTYQKQLCCVIAACCSSFLLDDQTND